ncbi:MAG TPA: glycoside hydrolase family 3 C-terminal domain-containing protein, partial [Blastocatellia bacterium]|nr:glycoside hydrolase family 3 C-terminal domain-containing protein [Blastocatellia bacterium]
AIKAGINQFLDRYQDGVNAALKANLLTEADVNEVIKGEFRVLIKLGLLDPPDMVPYSSIGGAEEPWLRQENKDAVRMVTRKSIVLLKNNGNLLPLDKRTLKSIAVIGPRANDVLLDWYSGTPPYTVSPVEGIKNKVGPGTNVSYAVGGEEAVKLAKSSDVAIVCVGNHPTGGEGAAWAKVSAPSEGREAVDRQSITLEQEELIKQIYRANPKTIVVLVSSFPYAINWTHENVAAILHLAHNSQEEGNALADVIFGDYNPAGRLVQTWPRTIDQLPAMMDYDIRHGRTYMYFKGQPLYAFGYGLSYTTFKYSNLRTSASSLAAKGSVSISVDVTNTGSRAGEEVVQMYATHLNSSVDRPLKELKGFKRIGLEPGQSRTVTLPLKGEQLAYWDPIKKSWTVESGTVRIQIGASSADLKLGREIRVTK